jgi:hypothetical protein
MIIVEAVGGALALLAIVNNYASLVRSMNRIHVEDWRKGAGTGGVNVSPSIFHLHD